MENIEPVAETSSPSRKRKFSATEKDDRAVKHRSSKACSSCRTRKVRCDITTNGSRCTNCRLDDLDCVVLASRRGKNNHARRKKSDLQFTAHLHAGSGTSPVVQPESSTKRIDVTGTSTPTALPTAPDVPAPDVPACVTFEEESENVGSDTNPVVDAEKGHMIIGADPSDFDGPLTPETATNAKLQNLTDQIRLPDFIAPISRRVLNEDLEFLVLKGALTLPEPDVRIHILRHYMFSVHPFMPMLDYRAFLGAVMHDRRENQVSLLLFQAVMFAGVHSLPLHTVNQMGFESTKQAREVFFTRARLLYEFDVESDNAAILQSLLLMSSWYSKLDARRHTWHWTGLAYDLARRMGLHREPAGLPGSDKKRKFRRRLWWSLYIRDRMIGLGVRSPLRIRDDDFDVEMLNMDDLDVEPLEDELDAVSAQALIPNQDERASTAGMCVQLARLCVLIGKVVSSQYTTLSTQPGVPHTTMVVSRRDEHHIEALKEFDGRLDDWFQAIPSKLKRSENSTASSKDICSDVHWAILNVAYLTTVNVLHRGQALQAPSRDGELQTVQKSSKSKVKSAARSITKTSQTLLRKDQVRYLSLVGVTALIAACLSHMLDIRSGDEDVRDASTFRLYQSLEVLQSLRGIYGSADAAVSFLASVTRKAGISLPVNVVTPSGHHFESDDRARAFASDRHLSPWKQAIFSPSAISNEQINPWRAGKPEDQHQDQRALLDNAAQTAPIGTHVPRSQSMSALQTPLLNDASFLTNTPVSFGSKDNVADQTFGELSNAVVDGAFSDWNLGYDLEPLSFNYDFYSDSFGFFDGQLQGF